MKFKDVEKGEVFADVHDRFFQKIEIVDKSGATKYNAISIVPKNGNYGLKKFKDTERELTYTAFYEDCGDFEEPFDYSYWLVRAMENYCVGYEHVEFNGKHYYLVHHA